MALPYDLPSLRFRVAQYVFDGLGKFSICGFEELFQGNIILLSK
jgi:hypothetical protein